MSFAVNVSIKLEGIQPPIVPPGFVGPMYLVKVEAGKYGLSPEPSMEDSINSSSEALAESVEDLIKDNLELWAQCQKTDADGTEYLSCLWIPKRKQWTEWKHD